MDKPCAFFCSYVDAKFMRGLKVMRISLDIPIEKSNEFLTAFGAPNAADPVPCAIARLDPEKALTRHENGSVSDAKALAADADAAAPHADQAKTDKPRTPFRDLPRSQQAAIKLQDGQFRYWMLQTFGGINFPQGEDDTEAFDAALKKKLGISSKKELDTSPEKGEAFDRLLASFDYRGRA